MASQRRLEPVDQTSSEDMVDRNESLDDWDDDRDPDYVADSAPDSDSDTGESFIPVGLMTLNQASSRSLSPVIPFQGTLSSDSLLPDIQTSSNTPLTKTQPTKKSTKLDKRHFCLFCGKGITKLKRHLISFHRNEPEMFCFMSAVGKAKENELKKLRNAGDHLHNIDELKKGHDDIVVKRAINRPTTKDDFVPCPKCLGYFFKRDLWRHKCPNANSDENIPAKQLVKDGRMILPMTDEDGLGEVFESLRRDQVSIIVKNDEIIKMIALREFKRNGHDKDRHAHIRNKIRELGRLLVKLRERTNRSSAELKHFLCPGHFQNVLEVTKELAGYSSENKTYAKPVLAVKIGQSLQRCSVLLKAQSIERKNLQVRSDCDAFEELIKIKWNEEISSQAARTLYQNKKNNAKGIPLSEDISVLSKYLEEQSTSLRNALLEVGQKHEIKKHWARLAELTLTTIILFNRRRQGEVSKMTVDDYTKGLDAQSHSEDVLSGLSNFERALCKKLKRIEITGKRGRLVPVILTDSMKFSTDTLLKKREEAGVSSDNSYFFARTNNLSLGHFRGSDCLRKLTQEVPLKHPHLLRSTCLRKHIAMLTQLVNLKDHELDVIAQYMGHDIRVHREHYRLPSGTVQVAKVAKLLMALDKGKVPTESELNDDTIEYDDAEDESSNDDTSNLETESRIPSSQTHQSPRQTYDADSTLPSQSFDCHITAQRDMSGRRRWTAEEEEACLRGFRRQIAVAHLPGKSDILKVIKEEPALANRTWIQVKNFIRNKIKKSS